MQIYIEKRVNRAKSNKNAQFEEKRNTRWCNVGAKSCAQKDKKSKKGLIQNEIKGLLKLSFFFFCRNTWACCLLKPWSIRAQWPGMDVWQDAVTTCPSNKWLWIAWDVFIYTVSIDGLREKICYQFCSLKFLKIVTIITSSFPVSFPFCLPTLPPAAITFDLYIYCKDKQSWA